LRRIISGLFGSVAESGGESSGETILRPGELERIGTDEDPMRDHEAAF